MLRIEEVKLTTGLQTDVSPKAIDTQKNRLVVNPILDALNARYISNDDGNEFIFESIKGTVKVTNADLPGGTNIQIGSFEDVRTNTLIFFLYNSGGSHGVYKYSPATGLITTLIQNSLLSFQNNPRYLITGVGIQGDLLYWSDGYNPQRVINITRNYAGLASDKPITLIKEHPTFRPEILSQANFPLIPTPKGHPTFRSEFSALQFNKLVDKNLQFSYQYIFIDNEKSVLSPFSKLSYAELDPTINLNSTTNNTVSVYFDVPTEISAYVKSINLLVREGNTGTWRIFKKVSTINTTFGVDYNGYDPETPIADAESVKIQEAVPTVSKALAVHKNRVLVSTDEEGFGITLSGGNFPITLTVAEVLENYTAGPSLNTYFKRGGSRSFGVAVFDTKGRSMGVFGRTKINFTKPDDQNNVLDNFDIDTQRPYATVNLSGNLSASPKAAYISLVCTDEEYYEDYMQIPVLVYPYRYEKGDAALLPGEVEVDGRVYFHSPSTATQFNKLHLLLPKEAPFIPTNEYYVRLRSQLGTPPYSSAKTEKVIAVEGSQFVVVNNLGITNWTGTRIIFVEIFKPKAAPGNSFYEITDRIPLVGGVPSQTAFTVYGDQYYIQNQQFTFRQDAADSTSGGFIPAALTRTASIESPTPTYGYNSVWKVPSESKSTNMLSADRKILDYTKKDWSKGKVFVELPNPIQLDRSNVVRFSNQYLADSSINGLSSFDSGDEYPLPTDRSRITKLVPIANNVLAVHERTLTTLYIEQRMIKNASGAEQLVVTDKFIGFDNEIRKNKCGSYHPESIAKEDGGLVFGFDVFRGVVWQFSNEGVSIISDFGKATDASDKATAILPYKDTCKILGGIDQEHTEYLLSFVFPSGQESQNETWGYNWEKNIWTVRHSSVPDGWAKVGQQLISFKDGELWLHHQNAVYNNFYGVQYTRVFRIAVNPFPGISKNFMALQIATNLLCDPATPEFECVKCYTEDGQETSMKADDFELIEGVYYGPILKDVNTLPALIPAGKIALRDGDDMLGKYIEVELINNHTSDPCPVQFLNVSYTDSQYSK